jgi:hypothetical protein|tara:strand:+ start:2487 stop:2702 length:216 start_codon:yes stop_codon:yes gene_type:complete
MIRIIATEQDTWFITYNEDKSIIHYGEALTGKSIESGQPDNDPLYYDKADWLIRLAELGVSPEELEQYNDI